MGTIRTLLNDEPNFSLDHLSNLTSYSRKYLKMTTRAVGGRGGGHSGVPLPTAPDILNSPLSGTWGAFLCMRIVFCQRLTAILPWISRAPAI